MVATPQYLDPARRVLASAPNLEYPLWGIQITHSEFIQGNGVDDITSHYLVNRPTDLDITLEDDTVQPFRASYFQLVLPRLDGKGQQDAQLSLQNVDRVIIDELELAILQPTERIEVVIRLFLEDDLTAGPQNVPLRLTLTAVHADPRTVSGVAGRQDTLNRPFPMDVYRIEQWPGLDR